MNLRSFQVVDKLNAHSGTPPVTAIYLLTSIVPSTLCEPMVNSTV